MALTEYRRKRNFRRTSEPRGGETKVGKRLKFVVQKHAASHLHYDFRLELEGVLKSWAVPKGPSVDPTVKRLAVHVEDHPLEYGRFEGSIPEGEYGGGTVLLWDHGSWAPIGDAEQNLQAGHLKFVLEGKKLHGRWVLIRSGNQRLSPGDERNWLLIKERDEFAEPGRDILVDEPLSVTTNRDLEEIAAGGAFTSEEAKAEKTAGKDRRRSQPTKSITVAIAAALKSVKHTAAPFPRTAKVQLATLAKSTPEGNDWIHEIKYDGYRMLCQIEKGSVRFITRNGNDWTDRFPQLIKEARRLPVENGVLDGEMVIFDAKGHTSFQALQNAFQKGAPAPFKYVAFDLLFCNGRDVGDAAIEDRKSLLRRVLPGDANSLIRYSDHVQGNGAKFFAEAARMKLEGIVSKKVGRPYVAGRGLDWIKVKASLQDEFVIGGFTEPAGSRKHFGALLLGYYDDAGQLRYAGRVGAGFDQWSLKTLHEKFAKLIQKTPPFADLAGRATVANITWLQPSLVAQIEFSNWTNDRQLRHPAFLGLREDKSANSVVRDLALMSQDVNSRQGADSAVHPAKPTRTQPVRRGKGEAGQDDPIDCVGVRLTHPNKLLYPDSKLTKLDLVEYYQQVADWMLPHVENRLLSLVRCPGGNGDKCFFQKHPDAGSPDTLRQFEIREGSSRERYLGVNDLSGLVALVQRGVLEIHTWGSRADRWDLPDRLTLDLDPDPAVTWPDVLEAARQLRLLLEHLELVSFVKTTGGKGLHVVIPIQRRSSWDEAKTFCRAIADFMVSAAPDRYIAKSSKAARKNKIFIDYLRNDRGATAIAPYSTRNSSNASVSVPLTWDELSSRVKSDHFTVRNLPRRLAKLTKDPWSGIATVRQTIKASMLKALEAR